MDRRETEVSVGNGFLRVGYSVFELRGLRISGSSTQDPPCMKVEFRNEGFCDPVIFHFPGALFELGQFFFEEVVKAVQHEKSWRDPTWCSPSSEQIRRDLDSVV